METEMEKTQTCNPKLMSTKFLELDSNGGQLEGSEQRSDEIERRKKGVGEEAEG